MQAMIFAAGLGSRFKPWTDKHPKALALVNGKSLLQRNVEYLQQFGIFNLIVNVHHFADQITDEIKKNKGWESTITISDETNEVLETGGGLKKASWYFEKTFVVINADILTDLNLQTLTDFHNKQKPIATLAVTDRNTSRYLLFDDEDSLCGWRNVKTNEQKISKAKPNLIQKAFSGIHIIEPAIFSLIKQTGKFSIVDTYLDLAKTETIKGFDHSNSKLIDVGNPDSLADAEKIFP